MLQNWALLLWSKQSEPDNHCQETRSTKENVEMMVTTTIAPHEPPPSLRPCPVYLKELSSKDKEETHVAKLQ